MPSCCVPGCKSRFYKKPKDIQFFSFPTKRPEQCTLWSKAVGRDNWKSSKWTKICSLHFTELDYFPRFPGVIRYLKRNAIPTQMMGSRCDSKTENRKNNLMAEDSTVSTHFKVKRVKKLQSISMKKVKSNPQPIALIKVLHKVPNPIDNGNRPNAESEQILPHDVSNSIVSEQKTQAFNILPDRASVAVAVKQEVETVKSSPSKPFNTVFARKAIETVNKLPQKLSKAVVKEEKIDFVDTSPQKVSNAVVNEKVTEPIIIVPSVNNQVGTGKKPIVPIKILTRKSSNGVNRKRMKSMIRILPRQMPTVVGNAKQIEPVKILVHKVAKDKRIVPIKILPRLDTSAIIDVKQAERHVKVDSAHHTMRILPVKDSNPILAVRCPLSNQETYMPFPTQYLPRQKDELPMMKIEKEKNAEIVLIDDDSDAEEKLKKNHKIEETTQIEVLKKEIIKLNQTIIRQKKRMQYILQMRTSRRGEKRNDVDS